MRLFLCCSSARTIFPPRDLHTLTHVRSRLHTLANATRAQGKHLNSSTPNGKSWWVNLPSSHRSLNCGTRSGRRCSVDRFFLAQKLQNSFFFSPFFLPTNRVLWCGAGFRADRNHDDTQTTGATSGLTRLSWFWPLLLALAEREARASQSVRIWIAVCVCVCVDFPCTLGKHDDGIPT